MPNMTPIEDARSVFEVYRAMNTISDGLLTQLGLVSFWTVLFMVLLGRGNTPAESFMAASGAVSIVSLLFLAIGLLGMVWFVGFSLLFALSAVGVYLRNKTS